MDHNPGEECFVGVERSLMVKSMAMKDLVWERKLFASELRSLERETQTDFVRERKEVLAKLVPEMEEQMLQLRESIRRMLESGSDQLNPSAKYYVLAEKMLKV
mmetsp:Transcript_28649/g.61447  ORF Transcript_28649/g.61447 Transcript_28649/m.61447 type:complete len:103 (-) Transcript_28649:239-547(-)